LLNTLGLLALDLVFIALLIVAVITLRTPAVRTIVVVIATLQVIRTTLQLLQSRLPASLISVTSVLLITTGRANVFVFVFVCVCVCVFSCLKRCFNLGLVRASLVPDWIIVFHFLLGNPAHAAGVSAAGGVAASLKMAFGRPAIPKDQETHLQVLWAQVHCPKSKRGRRRD